MTRDKETFVTENDRATKQLLVLMRLTVTSMRFVANGISDHQCMVHPKTLKAWSTGTI
ncbi:MAG: hypothetical protein O2856_14155 [Planctomycetota bacterium]|nr:hypothetical protein [Planctomycetota bacterium]